MLEALGRRLTASCRSILADGAPSEKPGNPEPKRPEAATLVDGGEGSSLSRRPSAAPASMGRGANNIIHRCKRGDPEPMRPEAGIRQGKE